MKIVLGCMVLSLTQACNHHFMKNGASCYSGNNCAFGCTKSGECWSQCDGELILCTYGSAFIEGVQPFLSVSLLNS